MTISVIQITDTIFQYFKPINRGINKRTANKTNKRFLSPISFKNRFWLIQYNKNKPSPQTIKTSFKKYFLILAYITGKKNREQIIIDKIDEPVTPLGPKRLNEFLITSTPLKLLYIIIKLTKGKRFHAYHPDFQIAQEILH
ncbi:MAG: hypothetical protein KAX18_06285 [Candidatus Lokiarchaeota archaeon]|nr:hypothetical protein [Candidatus Lokiarchaeota archaeon]